MAEAQRSTRTFAILLAGMAALGPFSIDTYLPSFHEIAEDLGATPLQVQQTLSAYLLAFATMTLWHGALSDRFGRRRVILVALALFGAASVGCAFATSIEQLWVGGRCRASPPAPAWSSPAPSCAICSTARRPSA